MTGAGSDMYAVHNITSNVGTGSPDVFEPYDHATSAVLAEPGRTYTVRADIVIKREGVVPVHAFGLDGDVVTVYVAASAAQSMPYHAYEAAGLAYLDGVLDDIYPYEPDAAPEIDPGKVAAAAAHAGSMPAGVGAAPQRSDGEWLDALAGAYLDGAGAAGKPGMRADLAALGYGAAEADAVLGRLGAAAVPAGAGGGGPPAARVDPGGAGKPLASDAGGAGKPLASDAGGAAIEVRGIVRAADYHSRPGTIPVNGISVCAYDYGTVTAAIERATLLRTLDGIDACTHTNNAGAYRIQGVNATDPGGDGSAVDLFVAVVSNGTDRLAVLGLDLRHYYQASQVSSDHAGSTLDADVVLNASNSGAARIIDAVSDGRDFFGDHGVDLGEGPSVLWQHDAGASEFPTVRTDVSQYDPRRDWIILNGNTSRTEDASSLRYVILHELAHYAQDATGRLGLQLRRGTLVSHKNERGLRVGRGRRRLGAPPSRRVACHAAFRRTRRQRRRRPC